MTTPIAKILVVDDEEANLDFFEFILKAENYIVVKARDGIEALEKFDQLQPDIVLLDLMMPRLTGYDVCERLRRNPNARHVPIMMLTGMEERDIRISAWSEAMGLATRRCEEASNPKAWTASSLRNE